MHGLCYTRVVNLLQVSYSTLRTRRAQCRSRHEGIDYAAARTARCIRGRPYSMRSGHQASSPKEKRKSGELSYEQPGSCYITYLLLMSTANLPGLRGQKKKAGLGYLLHPKTKRQAERAASCSIETTSPLMVIEWRPLFETVVLFLHYTGAVSSPPPALHSVLLSPPTIW